MHRFENKLFSCNPCSKPHQSKSEGGERGGAGGSTSREHLELHGDAVWRQSPEESGQESASSARALGPTVFPAGPGSRLNCGEAGHIRERAGLADDEPRHSPHCSCFR